jgi:hypothetical protein
MYFTVSVKFLDTKTKLQYTVISLLLPYDRARARLCGHILREYNSSNILYQSISTNKWSHAVRAFFHIGQVPAVAADDMPILTLKYGSRWQPFLLLFFSSSLFPLHSLFFSVLILKVGPKKM